MARESPLTVGKSIWEVKANSSSRIGGDFWNSLDLSGEARSQRLSVALAGARTLTLTKPTALGSLPSARAKGRSRAIVAVGRRYQNPVLAGA